MWRYDLHCVRGVRPCGRLYCVNRLIAIRLREWFTVAREILGVLPQICAVGSGTYCSQKCCELEQVDLALVSLLVLALG